MRETSKEPVRMAEKIESMSGGVRIRVFLFPVTETLVTHQDSSPFNPNGFLLDATVFGM
jgi:hypothetical protein